MVIQFAPRKNRNNFVRRKKILKVTKKNCQQRARNLEMLAVRACLSRRARIPTHRFAHNYRWIE